MVGLRQRQQQSLYSILFAFLLLNNNLSWCVADDAAAANDDAYNYNENAADDYYNETDDDAAEAYQKGFTVCEDSALYVSDLSVLCNSPGAYYYGSGKYRNSYTCIVGDKAKVSITFQITEDIDYETTGITPFIDLHVGEYGFSGEYVYEDVELCSLSTLTSKTSGVSCPGIGNYQLDVSFYLSDEYYVHDSNSSFEPIVTLGFKANIDDGDYELGGANLEKCEEMQYTNGGNLKVTANNILNFFLTFGILILAVSSVTIFGYCMYVQMQPEKPSITDTFGAADEDYLEGKYENYHINWTSSKSLVDILET